MNEESIIRSLTIDMNTLNSEMIALKIVNLEFSTRIAELEARLNYVINGRPSGGQEGQEGHTLLKVENPDCNENPNCNENSDCVVDSTQG